MKNLILQTERHRLPPPPEGEVGEGSRSNVVAVDLAYLATPPSDVVEAHHSACLVLNEDGTLQCFLDDETGSHSRMYWNLDLNSVMEDAEVAPLSRDGWFSVWILNNNHGNTDEEKRPQACCLNRCTGAIVTVSLEATPVLELVGEFEKGILAAAWSPDGQVLALIVSQQDEDDPNQEHIMLLTMNNKFEVLNECVLESILAVGTATTMVSLEWRPDGKWLAVLSSTASTAREGEKSQEKQQSQSCVLRIYNPIDFSSSPPAMGRTEDGSGKLLPGLNTPVLAWAGPSCSLVLATVQTAGSLTKICFVESNGLAHGGFTLRDKQCTVHQMAWWNSAESSNSLLAIHLTTNKGKEEKVQLWHRSNYYWYLKQEFQFDPTLSSVACLQWQSSSSFSATSASSLESMGMHHLTILQRNGVRILYQFLWQETISPQKNTSLVVDGCQLMCTPLAQALVPPPIAAAKVTLVAPIRHIALAPQSFVRDDDANFMAVVHLSDGSLVILGGEQKEVDKKGQPPMIANYHPPKVLAKIDSAMVQKALIARSALPHSPLHSFHNLLVTSVAAAGDGPVQIDCIAVEICNNDGSGDQILEIALSYAPVTGEEQGNDPPIRCLNRIPLEDGRVLAMTHWHDEIDSLKRSTDTDNRKGALVQLHDGRLLEYTEGSIVQGTMEPLLEPCPRIVGLRRRHVDEDHRVIGMSWRRRFYCGEVLLADSISSFDISERFLCYATRGASHCQLKFIARSQLFMLDPLMGSSEENALVIAAEYESRTVERGSRIVTLLSNKPMAVLQLPRGNLEGVAPRALVLPHILNQLVHNGNYKYALEMMRQQKVDLNLLVDWNPAEFLNKGAEELLAQVTNVDHLNLFISSLRNENVTQTRHLLPLWLLKEFNLSPATNSFFDFSTKVNQVCQKLRSLMADEAQVGDVMLLPVLSTFAKEEPAQLESALSLIKSKTLEHCEATGTDAVGSNKKKLPLFSERAQSAIQYLAFLASYDMLFDTALGMYDLDLARAVARNSQMDPKNYLPLIQRYRDLPQFYSQYEIDIRLKRYPEALHNLFQSFQLGEVGSEGLSIANAFGDSLTLIKNHKLHRLGLELVQDDQNRREILLDLCQHLLLSGEGENALSILLTIPEPFPVDQIMQAARSCQDWRTYFSFAALSANDEANDKSMEFGKATLSNLARDVTQTMVIAATSATEAKKREILSDAARIMLDYGNDAAEAVSLLLQAESWSEARRIAVLYGMPALVRKCTDSAVSKAYSTIDDLVERASTFATTMGRYREVLELRKEAYARGEDLLPSEDVQGGDESASLFSAASQASHLTGVSKSSTGSSASFSTVISISSKSSSFSISGSDQTNRHKSKYNQIGQQSGGKKKKKKKNQGRTKLIPGSEKELEMIVETLQWQSLDSTFCSAVVETIVFLVRTGELPLSTNLYQTFQDSAKKIVDCQETLARDQVEKRLKHEDKIRREGVREEVIVHPLEKKVDSIKCGSLPESIHRLFEVVANG